ncbi:4-hydroxy-3-methylbut-2-enyl diphosphate reductase [Longibacter salinarum]|uniref:4-hydroxy-3-methylbut-2-enyl diphosphate reductase n=1 Tax=Longibacter salinarum TaxID=1850348 RepID=A0A2A8CVX6_9BACT|nr:4-hydroxy-3-methylbut-2-enyl diphosphate reductase [Longibacter salinarum]PEN12773.1 4-hydroxy-3-methylbut-2-enyl diphosphate reductase [Longibacter salinarum]
MKQFDVPVFYRSPIISTVKDARKTLDPRKKDLSPSVIDFGPVRFKIARHFGFCYGVENAIEIAYRALDENPDKRVFLLSEMIHNPHVNTDLQERGVKFLRTTSGEQLIPFDELNEDDVVIIPAFGTTLEVEQTLADLGVDTETYDTTCPFVEKVWRKSKQIGGDEYSIVVHGKRYHEETRATFSHAKEQGPVVVVRNMEEAEDLAKVIRGDEDAEFFYKHFDDKYSEGFDPETDLERLGVVNQTTMLATETKAIANLLREAVIDRYGVDNVKEHFADTSDTLCYATNENQDATLSLIDDGGDVGIVVGGYNSSNTSHLVELCEEKMPTYFIRSASEFDSPAEIKHFDLHRQDVTTTENWFPTDDTPVDIVLTSGASCPDALLDEVIRKVVAWFPDARSVEEALEPFETAQEEE